MNTIALTPREAVATAVARVDAQRATGVPLERAIHNVAVGAGVSPMKLGRLYVDRADGADGARRRAA